MITLLKIKVVSIQKNETIKCYFSQGINIQNNKKLSYNINSMNISDFIIICLINKMYVILFINVDHLLIYICLQ